jgi:hypothetical protein
VQPDSKEEAAEEATATGPLETKAVEQRSEAEQPVKKRMPKPVTQTEEEESPLPIRVPQTYRLPRWLVEDLARAAMERKIKRRGTMVATGHRSQSNSGMAQPSWEASKQTSLHSHSKRRPHNDHSSDSSD